MQPPKIRCVCVCVTVCVCLCLFISAHPFQSGFKGNQKENTPFGATPTLTHIQLPPFVNKLGFRRPRCSSPETWQASLKPTAFDLSPWVKLRTKTRSCLRYRYVSKFGDRPLIHECSANKKRACNEVFFICRRAPSGNTTTHWLPLGVVTGWLLCSTENAQWRAPDCYPQ